MHREGLVIAELLQLLNDVQGLALRRTDWLTMRIFEWIDQKTTVGIGFSTK